MTDQQKETKKTCNHIMHNQEPCGRELYDDELCLFHSKDIERKKAEFNQEFEKLQALEEYDFSGFGFPGDISFEKRIFKKKVNFQKAYFSRNANFGGAQFHGEVYFGESQFSQDVSFWETHFSEKADFVRNQFMGKANFGRSTFKEDASFWGVQFSERTDFGSVIFSEKADFGRTSFSGYASFGKTQFIGNVSFWRAQFKEDAYFGKTIYAEDAAFRGAQFSGETNFSKARLYENGNFRKAQFHHAKKCFMEDTYFYNINGLFEFLGAKENKKTFNYSNRTEFLPDHFSLILGEEAKAKYPIISRKISDDMYLLSFKNSHPKLHYLWWLLADCGRSFLRWAAWSLGMAVFFAILYIIIGPGAFKAKPEGYTWFSFIYYSVVTFTTLGFGDITPIKWYTEILVTIEVILGYIMLGGLVSILANKMARRS